MENEWDIVTKFYGNMLVGDKIRIDNIIYMKPVQNSCFHLTHMLISLTDGELYHFSRIINPDNFDQVKKVPGLISIKIY